jgi:UDP-N-acetylglucosamine:LPS N-acetylglucosamine transferase
MSRPQRVLAVASAGGHWIQLFRLRQAWDDCSVTYVSSDPGLREVVEIDARSRNQGRPGFCTIVEANRWQKIRLLRSLLQLAAILARVRPHVVITTGAAPGYFAIRLARLFGSRTVWLDSIANGEELSLSGRKAGRHVDLWLTQWEDLARPGGPHFRGSVL